MEILGLKTFELLILIIVAVVVFLPVAFLFKFLAKNRGQSPWVAFGVSYIPIVNFIYLIWLMILPKKNF